MRLARAEIRNFRSIKSITINFEPKCRVLVGINESGKTNILRALALLDPSRSVAAEDVRDFPPQEDFNAEAYVRFVFAFEKDERLAHLEGVIGKVAPRDSSAPVATFAGKDLTLAQFFDTRTEGLYSIDLRKRTRSATYWTLSNKYGDAPGWKKASSACPASQQVTLADGSQAPLQQFVMVHEGLLGDVPPAYLVDVRATDVNALVGERIVAYVAAHLPPCLYWTYSDSNLLPAQIALDAFASSPATCEPLRQMFALADVDDIGQAITSAKTRPNGVRNLLNRVADRATEHMKTVWKEYRGITIQLQPNGPNIDASIKDEFNWYDFSRRSDGFKRFIGFLMMVSAKVRTEQLVDILYLQDEPDTGLHPSGARYLRDELIAIAKSNYVVYSTHSIFMVDRELQHRHLIVEKKSEITEVREVNESNIVDEEVIYNALGHSIFESLRKQNIIFEGWRDKRLCHVALKTPPAKHMGLKEAFGELGMCHARGVKDVGRITPILELANRSWVVVSDGDKPAVEQQKQYDGEGPWFRYDELMPDAGIVTGEDFIKVETLRSHWEAMRSENPALPEIKADDFVAGEGRLRIIAKLLGAAGITGDQSKAVIESLKERVFSSLKASNIEDRYFDLLVAVVQKVPKAPD